MGERISESSGLHGRGRGIGREAILNQVRTVSEREGKGIRDEERKKEQNAGRDSSSLCMTQIKAWVRKSVRVATEFNYVRNFPISRLSRVGDFESCIIEKN